MPPPFAALTRSFQSPVRWQNVDQKPVVRKARSAFRDDERASLSRTLQDLLFLLSKPVYTPNIADGRNYDL
jgi:hypothetical protein